ncbi:hypothetical protein ACFFHM_22335 [Halalkalibacter kiskunsagensis]|uniref:Uncharacterized protein n=1 Tax=Halalkalibacter kiskunsagensis TaxID=1548599 RepID=A0ABV6KIK3_9BACI
MSNSKNDIQVVYRKDPKARQMQEVYWSKISNGLEEKRTVDDAIISPGNKLFQQMIGKQIMITTRANQLKILGQQFRPVFYGKVVFVTNGYITMDPVQVELPDKTDYYFTTPLHFPIERISNFAPFRFKKGKKG